MSQRARLAWVAAVAVCVGVLGVQGADLLATATAPPPARTQEAADDGPAVAGHDPAATSENTDLDDASASDPDAAGDAGEPTPPQATPTPVDVAPASTPAPRPTPEPPPEPAGSPEVRAALLRAIDGAGVDASKLSVLVTDDDGQVVVELNADQPRVPASTAKIVTAAAALEVFGPDHRFVTQLRATAQPEAGVVDGDLVLLGGGDPALVSPRFGAEVVSERPQTPLVALADAVVAAGVTDVTGRLVGNPGAIGSQPLAAGWPSHYLGRLHAGRVSGLTVDLGRDVTEDGGRLIGTAADDPAATTARVLAVLLEERGVRVHAGTAVSRSPTEIPPLLVAEVSSPPLVDLLAYVVQRSDNHLADSIFRSLGALAGDSTWSGSARAATAALGDLEIDWRRAVLADGSGLSRSSRLTARQLVDVDIAQTTGPDGPQWVLLQAAAGERGTLRNRMRGTFAEGRVVGKTGSLTDARSLVGSAVGAQGRYHFAVLADNLDREERDRVRALTDAVATITAEGAEGCGRVEAPPPEPELPGPFFELRCP